MAKAIIVEPCFAISGGTIVGNAPVVVRNTKLVGGFDFFEVTKTHSNIERMLAPLKRGERVLAGTTVIEDLLLARNDLFHTADIAPEVANMALPAGKVSRKKRLATTDFVVMTVQAPHVNGHTVQMRVLHNGRNNCPLWMELATENIEYLQNAFAHQLPRGPAIKKIGSRSKSLSASFL